MSRTPLTYTWVIHNVKGRGNEWEECSSEFKKKGGGERNVFFTLSAHYEEGNILLYLKWKFSTIGLALISKCNFSILNSEAARQVLFSKQFCGIKYCYSAEKSLSTTFDDLDKYLVNNRLTIQVDVTIQSSDDDEVVFKEPCKVVQDNIRQGLHSLYQDEALADVIIICQGQEFKAHKVVLASQSPVLRKMFEVDMKEKETNIVEMTDIGPEVVSALLAYIYTGEAPNVETLAKDLLMVAHKYEIPRLLTVCQEQLINKLELSNALEIYSSAKLYGADKLQKVCMRFICSNFDALCKTPKWEGLTDHEEKALLLDIVNTIRF